VLIQTHLAKCTENIVYYKSDIQQPSFCLWHTWHNFL